MPRVPQYGPPVTCAHTHPHQHGTYLAYKRDKCRCVPCSTAMSRRNKADKLKASRGQNNTSVSAERTRQHLHALKAAGVSVREISRRTGYSTSLLERIYRGVLTGTTQSTQDDVLSIPVPHLRRYDKSRIDATGTRRRIRALVAIGHSLKVIAEDAGLSHDVPTRISRVDNPHQWVHIDVADKIRATYDRLWDQTPPQNTPRQRDKATMSRNRATANGWLPPLAWDDDQIDDPAYTPNVTHIRKQTMADAAAHRLDELEHLLASGEALRSAVIRAGYSTPRKAREAAAHAGRTRLVRTINEEQETAA